MVKYLMEHGANINKDYYWNTPFIYCVRKRRLGYNTKFNKTRIIYG